jgi:hypothetical protein
MYYSCRILMFVHLYFLEAHVDLMQFTFYLLGLFYFVLYGLIIIVVCVEEQYMSMHQFMFGDISSIIF